jgi:predicted nuclease of predicted toxin-antitoxin system
MKFLVDMNLSPRWLGVLHNAGWPAVHWSSVGRGTEPDSEIMSYAAKNNYIVVTHDLDFSSILAATHGNKPSVVQVRMQDIAPEVFGPHVVAVLLHMEKELEAGALLTIGRRQTRVRMLPIVAAE